MTNEDLSEEKRKEKVEIYIYLYKVKRRQIIKPESILRSNFLNNLKLRLQKYQENVAFLAELKIKILFKHASLIKYIFFCFFRASFSCEFHPVWDYFSLQCLSLLIGWRVKKLVLLNFTWTLTIGLYLRFEDEFNIENTNFRKLTGNGNHSREKLLNLF